MRRLPAVAARLRGRAARSRRRGRDRLLPRSDARRGRRTVRAVPRRGVDRHRGGPPADRRGPARVGGTRDDRRVRDRRRRAGAAQLPRRGRARRAGLRAPRVRRHARDLDADLAPRPRRLRAPGLPDRQAAAPRGDLRVPQRTRARGPVAQRVPRVQVARERVRDGRARDPLPGADHACRLRRAVPELRPRLLRLLRPDGDPERAGAHPRAARRRRDAARTRPPAAHVQRQRAGIPRGVDAPGGGR